MIAAGSAPVAGRWLRVSGSGQSEAGQEPDIDRYIAGRGYEPGPVYRLHGKSATRGEQDEMFGRVLDDVRTGRIDVLVAWSIDRLDRRGIGSAFGMRQALTDAGGTVEFVREPTAGELEYAIKSWLAQEEAKHKAERSRTGREETRANGAATSRPPWGLVSAGPRRHKQWTPTGQGGVWVPAVFEGIAAGKSLRVLGEELRAGGYTGPASAPGLSAMVRNPAYKGVAYDPSGAIGHRCEALVSPTAWQAANDALADRTRTRRGPRLARSMLAGAITCGACGTTLYRDKIRRGRDRAYYMCAGCPYTIPLVRTEDIVDATVRENDRIVYRRTWVPGTDHLDAIADVSDEIARLGLRGLDEEAEDAERSRLRAKRRHLESLPSVPGRWDEDVDPDHQSYAQWWADTPDGERGHWLRDNGYSVTATKVSLTIAFPWGTALTIPLT